MPERSRLEKIKSRQASYRDSGVILEGSHPSCRINTFHEGFSGKMHVIFRALWQFWQRQNGKTLLILSVSEFLINYIIQFKYFNNDQWYSKNAMHLMSIVVESSNYTTQNRSHRARRTHVFSSIPGHRRCWDSCRKPHRRSWPSGLKTRCSGTAAQRTKMKHVVTNAAVCCKHLEYVCGLITKSHCIHWLTVFFRQQCSVHCFYCFRPNKSSS